MGDGAVALPRLGAISRPWFIFVFFFSFFYRILQSLWNILKPREIQSDSKLFVWWWAQNMNLGFTYRINLR